MTFYALLIKEIRLRVRRERLIWVLVIYILILGLLEWLTFNNATSNYNIYTLNNTGASIYFWLTIIQCLLIVFIAPAFTASSINSEKERQTYDLLLCSRLSSFSLVTGKLLSGLSSTLLLIAATIPLFSLIFFFGGIDPLQIVQDQFLFLVTAVLVATFALFCSILFSRPATSTAITYVGILLWLVGPAIFLVILTSTGTASVQNISIPTVINQGGNVKTYPSNFPIPLIWHPIAPLYKGIVNGIGNNYSFSYLLWNGFSISPWLTYIIFSLVAIAVLFLLSVWLVKPYPMTRLRARFHKGYKKNRRTDGLEEVGSTLDITDHETDHTTLTHSTHLDKAD